MADVGKQLRYYNGPGPKILYKDIGEGYYAQVMATIDVGADGENPVSPTNPAPVAGPNTKVLRATPVVSASPDYAINDVLGGKMILTDIARKDGSGGIINSVIMTSKVDIPVGVSIDVLFFDADPVNSTFTDNAILNLSLTDLPYLLPGIAQLNTKVSLGTSSVLIAQNLGIPVDTITTDNLWAVAVVRGAATLNLASTSDIQFVFGFLPD